MKQFEWTTIYKGQQIYLNVVCKTQKKAAELFDTTTNQIRNYGYSFEPRDRECVDNPEKVYAYFDSGDMFREHHDLLRKFIPLEEMQKVIDKYLDKKHNKWKKERGIE